MKTFADHSPPFVGSKRMRTMRAMLTPALLLTALLVMTGTVHGQCGYEWQEGFNLPGADGPVYASALFDFGDGPEVVVGRSVEVGGSPVMRLQASTWTPVGTGLSGTVRSFAVGSLELGGRPLLVAGGSFAITGIEGSTPIVAWDGSQWIPLMIGTPGIACALAFFDNGIGNGPQLYAAGAFDVNGPTKPGKQNIAHRTGNTWSFTETSPSITFVRALCVFDDGHGPALYAAGEFNLIDGVQANRIARWNGRQWSALGEGITINQGPENPFGRVMVLAVFDDDSGPALFAGGRFDTAGGQNANGIARWDGDAWTGLASGVGQLKDNGPSVDALTVYNDGTGAALLAAGSFETAGGVAVANVAKWQDSSWSKLQKGVGDSSDSVATVVVLPEGDSRGDHVFFGGSFETAGGIPAHNIALWASGNLPPRIVHAPDDRTRPPGSSTTFDVTVESGSASYQWLHDSSPLIDDERITGSNARSLTITNLQSSDNGEYIVVVTNDCGEVSSQPAMLVVRAQCSGDVTGVGNQVDDADFQAVISAWGPCNSCLADTDANGVVDIDDLLTVISQWGPCP